MSSSGPASGTDRAVLCERVAAALGEDRDLVIRTGHEIRDYLTYRAKCDVVRRAIPWKRIYELAKPLAAYYDDMAETIRWARKNAPGLRTIMPRSEVFSRGGANSVQEVAYTFLIYLAVIAAAADVLCQLFEKQV